MASTKTELTVLDGFAVYVIHGNKYRNTQLALHGDQYLHRLLVERDANGVASIRWGVDGPVTNAARTTFTQEEINQLADLQDKITADEAATQQAAAASQAEAARRVLDAQRQREAEWVDFDIYD